MKNIIKKIDYFRYLIFILIFSCFFVFSFETVNAIDSFIAKPKGLTLSPLRSELEIAPGTSVDGILTVTNSTEKPMLVNLTAEEFSVINQQYDYAFTVESNVAKWVTFSQDEINLAVGESKNVTFSVGAPLSAEPGGRYISLFASTVTDNSDNSVNSLQRIASLLYINVTGDVSRAGNLVSLSSPWLIGGESLFSIALQNTGTTHFRSRYNVQIKNLIGDDVVAEMSGDALILPGTVRLITDNLPIPKLPGIYKIVYTIGLGDTPAVSESRYIIYLPIYATAFLIIAVVAILGFIFRKKLKTL